MKMKNIIKASLILTIFIFSALSPAMELPSTTKLLIQTGIELYENGDYEGSLKLFDGGLDTIHDDETRILVHKYLALNYIAFNIKEKAYQEFKKIFFINPDFELQEAFSPVVMEIFEHAREDSSHLGILEIYSDPEEADVYLNGEFAGKTPYKKEIVFGRYFLEIRLFGYESYKSNFVLISKEMNLGKMKLPETHFYTRYKEGLAFYENGNYETALDTFFEVIVESREFPDAFIMIGLCYSKIPEMEYEGIMWIQDGISRAPEKIKGHKSLFEVYMKIEDYKAALLTLNKIEGLDESAKIEDWIKKQKLNLAGFGYE